MRNRVVVVRLVYEKDARLAVGPRSLDDLVEHIPGSLSSHYFPVPRAD